MGSKRPVLDGMRMFEWLLLGVWVMGSVVGKWGCMGYTDVEKWLNGIKAAVEEIPYTITFSNIIPNMTFPFHSTSSFTPSPPPPHPTTKTPSKLHA